MLHSIPGVWGSPLTDYCVWRKIASGQALCIKSKSLINLTVVPNTVVGDAPLRRKLLQGVKKVALRLCKWGSLL